MFIQFCHELVVTSEVSYRPVVEVAFLLQPSHCVGQILYSLRTTQERQYWCWSYHCV